MDGGTRSNLARQTILRGEALVHNESATRPADKGVGLRAGKVSYLNVYIARERQNPGKADEAFLVAEDCWPPSLGLTRRVVPHRAAFAT